MQYGISERYVALYEGAQKVLARPTNYDFDANWLVAGLWR
jgi:hypothetical protein